MRVSIKIFVVICTFVLTINGDHRPTTTSIDLAKTTTSQITCDDVGRAKAAADCAMKRGKFNAATCECEVSAATAPAPVCVQNVMCIQGDHWDTNLCRCVPNEPPTKCDSAMRAREAAACAKRKGTFNAETCQCTV